MTLKELLLSQHLAASRFKVRSFVTVAAVGLLSLELLAASGLIVVSTWRGDDYSAVARYRAGGLSFYAHRIFGWSPRPVSEAIILCYSKLTHLGRLPITLGFMAAMWALFGAATCAAVRQNGWGLRSETLIASSLLLASVVLSVPAETFYWPLGSFAYLPTLAGIAFVVLTSLEPASRRRFLIVNGCVLVGVAGSSEVGAMFTLSFSATHLAYAFYRSKLRAIDPKELACLAATAAISILILSMSVFGRVSANAESSGRGHRLVDSIVFSFSSIYSDVTGAGSSVTLHAAAYVLLLSGWIACLSHRRFKHGSESSLWLLLASLVITIYGSAFAGWYQFASSCCERHTTVREFMFLLCALVTCCIVARSLGSAVKYVPASVGPLAMLACAVLFARHEGPGWFAEYRHIRERLTVARENEKAGTSSGSRMSFQILPSSNIIENVALAPGEYDGEPTTPWEAQGILSYYRKSEIDVSSRAWGAK